VDPGSIPGGGTTILTPVKNAQLGLGPRRIPDWSADSLVRSFLASVKIRADKAVRAPVSSLVESALDSARIQHGNRVSKILCPYVGGSHHVSNVHGCCGVTMR